MGLTIIRGRQAGKKEFRLFAVCDLFERIAYIFGNSENRTSDKPGNRVAAAWHGRCIRHGSQRSVYRGRPPTSSPSAWK
jgi:hypothetical protein